MITFLIGLWLLLRRMRSARRLGAVAFQSVEGVGWQASIRPPYSNWRRLNGWSGMGPTMGHALADALASAAKNLTSGAAANSGVPKLGGAEFDE